MADRHNGPSAASAALDKADVSARHPAKGTYPPISSIPSTSTERLAKAGEDVKGAADREGSDTVLYLAYGSNMCAQTFLGVRKIRPLSQVNVCAPSIKLTFDLPGLPYREPCFANVGFRNAPEKTQDRQSELVHQDMEWDGGLIGVVYEVTQDDYRNIMRTEGAGSSYKEIVVPCFHIASKGTYSTGPKPFLARTLYASFQQDGDKGSWWQRFFGGRSRPDPNYAQPSARYLGLLKDGGREHDLPSSYQAYLASLQPYTITRWTQTVGMYSMLAIWAPMLIFFLTMTSKLADETGKLPPWLAKGVNSMWNMMWNSYDMVFKPLFGDGERTEERGDQRESEKGRLLDDGSA